MFSRVSEGDSSRLLVELAVLLESVAGVVLMLGATAGGAAASARIVEDSTAGAAGLAGAETLDDGISPDAVADKRAEGRTRTSGAATERLTGSASFAGAGVLVEADRADDGIFREVLADAGAERAMDSTAARLTGSAGYLGGSTAGADGVAEARGLDDAISLGTIAGPGEGKLLRAAALARSGTVEGAGNSVTEVGAGIAPGEASTTIGGLDACLLCGM